MDVVIQFLQSWAAVFGAVAFATVFMTYVAGRFGYTFWPVPSPQDLDLAEEVSAVQLERAAKLSLNSGKKYLPAFVFAAPFSFVGAVGLTFQKWHSESEPWIVIGAMAVGSFISRPGAKSVFYRQLLNRLGNTGEEFREGDLADKKVL